MVTDCAVVYVPVAGFTVGAGGAVVSVAAAVVKVQLRFARGWFAESRMAVVPPVRVAVYAVLLTRLALGLRIHWLVVPLRVTVARTSVVLPAARSVNVVVLTPCAASLKVAVTSLPTGTAVALP